MNRRNGHVIDPDRDAWERAWRLWRERGGEVEVDAQASVRLLEQCAQECGAV